MKKCTKCGKKKSLTEYHNRKSAKDGKQSHCKACSIAKIKDWQAKNAAKFKASWNNPEVLLRQRARKYGLTPDELTAMILDHGGICRICKKEYESLVVDHDHVTGSVRGMLCSRCNLRLGWVEIVGVDAIKDYLEGL